MAKLSLSEAARRWGVSRATINRRRKDGTLSVTKDGRSVFVDTSELVRVFGATNQTVHDTVSSRVRETARVSHSETSSSSELLHQKISFLEEKNEMLQSRLDQVTANEQKLLGIVEAQARQITDQSQSVKNNIWSRIFKL